MILPADEHNTRLTANVRPPAWINPTPRGRYHLAVLGAGPAGLVAAAGAAGLGARVALIERGLLGGDCLNVGCVPSKALLHSARVAALVRRAGEFGIRVPEGTTVDFPAVMERVRRLRADLSANDSAKRFLELGVDVFFGEGRFAGPDTLTVAGQTLHFHRAVLATGSRAACPAIPGLDAAGFLTNETVFNLTALPARLAVLGAGPIGCELAQAFARFGSRVHLLDLLPRILPREDPEAADCLGKALSRDGVELLVGTTVQAVDVQATGKALRLSNGRQIVVDALLLATGRVPNVEGIGLEAAGVRFDPRQGVLVNDRLQTTNRRIYAAGDVCSRWQFTHAADAMARLVLRNALFLGRSRVSDLTIPWCTYTDPEVARVGLSEEEARQRQVPVQVFVQPLRDVDRAVLDGETEGFVKVLVRQGTDRLVGATVVAAHAGDLIAELALALTNRLGLGRIAATLHPYPTQAEAIRKTGDAWQRTRLTPRIKRFLASWFAWQR